MIELIIVLAIIAILAGMLSMLIEGYQRNARLETANNRANMAYTGFQNILIQCEIKQDISVFGPGATGCIPIDIIVDDTAVGTNGDEDKITSVKVNGNPLSGNDLAKFKKVAAKEFSLSFSGAICVWVNFNDYQVDSACYFENASDVTDAKTKFDAKIGSHLSNNTFSTYDVQRSVSKNPGYYVGVYPIQSVLS